MRSEFCKTLFKILDRFDSSRIKVFALQLKCQRNIVLKIPFLVRFLSWNYLRNWRNFFDNFLWKGIFTITSISCTALGKFPLAGVWVREHLSRKSWLVLNWPLSQPCAKNNHRRSVFVSNLVFFLERRKSPQYDDEVLVFCALLQKNKAEKCTGKDANGRDGGYLTSKPENWTLFLSKVKYWWYPMHRCAHCLLHNA